MQLSQLERRTSRFGRDTIDHPSGSHDDVCNAAAGALVLTMGGEGAELPLVVVMKKMAARVAAGLDFFEAKPKPAVPIAWPAGHSTPKPQDLGKCPSCDSTCVTRLGSTGAPLFCNQCHSTWGAGSTTVMFAPAALGLCWCKPPVIPIIHEISGFKRCVQCGWQSTDMRWPTNGMSRATYLSGSYRRRS